MLLAILSERIADNMLLELLGRVIESFQSASGKGVPLGNLTSQLFANVYLDALDQFAKRFLLAKYYIRYADDFAFLSSDRERLLSFLPLIDLFLRDRLQLALHSDKVFLQTFAHGVDFLGWVHFPHHRVPRTAMKRRMLSRIRKYPVDSTLQSYLGMLSHGDAWELSERVRNEQWLWSA